LLGRELVVTLPFDIKGQTGKEKTESGEGFLSMSYRLAVDREPVRQVNPESFDDFYKHKDR